MTSVTNCLFLSVTKKTFCVRTRKKTTFYQILTVNLEILGKFGATQLALYDQFWTFVHTKRHLDYFVNRSQF